jgi:type IV secretion system protein VirD4
MYRIIRLTLIATVLLTAYVATLVIGLVPYAWLVAVVVVACVLSRRTYRYTAHGTARWAGPEDVPHLLEGSGLSVGELDGERSRFRALQALLNMRLSHRQACQKFLTAYQRRQPKPIVRLSTSVHTSIFAPTGVGKGTSCAVPFLLTCRDSAVVIDFKGELAQLTAAARRKMGHMVVVLDPFRVTTPHPDPFNPLAFIDPDTPTAMDDCRDLAEALVVRTGQEKEPHWVDSAEVWIAAMIAVTVCFADPEHRHLQSVRQLLTDPDKMQAAVKLMCESPDVWDGLLARLGHQLGHFKDKELSSTLTTTNRFLRFLDTIPVAESTRRSAFDPANLTKVKMTVYLVLPPEHMRAQSALLRMWVGAMLRGVVKGGLQEQNKVHFLLDEAASLGHMSVIEDALDKFRGYGVRLQFYYQSLGQLKKCWPEGGDQTLLSNCTQVFFGVNDQQTAEYVSNRLGEETIVVDSGGTSTGGSSQSSQQGGGSTSRSWNASDNWSQVARKLLKPEEVTALSERIAIIFVPGCLPIWTTLQRYYEKGFRTDCEIGTAKAVFDTLCLFLAAALLAVISTGIVLTQP